MPQTANNVSYSQKVGTLPNGDRYGIIVPDNPTGWIVVYTHGNSGTWNQFYTTAAWREMLYWFMDNGVTVCESAGAGDDWGGESSRTSYEQVVAACRSHLNTSGIPLQGIIVLGRSMGGLVAYWLASESTFAGNVSALIISSGTTNLALRYSVASGQDLVEMNVAYGIPGSERNVALFATNSVGHDPLLADPAVWDGKHVMQVYGTADTTVRFADHGQAWFDKYATNAGSLTRIDAMPGGDHSADNGTYHRVTEMSQFLTEVGVTKAEARPSYYFLSSKAYLVGPNKERFQIA